jgi:glycosyltransferase XagB
MLDSITYEEANVAVGNWLKQRRRWLKGFLQTWLVHNRRPMETLRELGGGGFMTLQCMTLGVFASALLHPLLFASGVWCLLPSHVAKANQDPVQMLLAGLNLFLLVAGYTTAAIAMRHGMSRVHLPRWPFLVCTLPVYWCLLSIAAWQAVFDFIFAPFHWHKTEHGLTRLTRPRDPRKRGKPVRSIYSRGRG